MSNETPVDQFKADIAAMRVKEANVGLEKAMRIVGTLLMILGAVLAGFAIVTTLNAELVKNAQPTVTGPAEQRDAIVYGVSGIVFAVIGATLFLRFSFGAYLRYWLARIVFEQDRRQ